MKNDTDGAVEVGFWIRRSIADWINLAYDGTHSRTVVIITMNLQNTQKLGNVFID